MGFPTKVQLIQRKKSQQWYINFPSAVAQAMDFDKGEDVEWTVADKGHLVLSRKHVPADPIDLKKTLHSSGKQKS
jgi:antitoxin component of MazEF toxin-antitoxin module